MRKLPIGVAIFALLFIYCTQAIAQSRGYYDAPYTRYEADAGTGNGTIITNFSQANIAYEASERTCVYLSNGQSREWITSSAFRGIVVRASGASSQTATSGQSVLAKLFIDNIQVATLTFDPSWGWKKLDDGNNNYSGTSNRNPRMRYDEQRYLHSSTVTAGKKIKIESQGNLYLDFIEIEDVPPPIPSPAGYKQYTGNGSDLQAWLNNNSGNIYIPAGNYNIGGCINIGSRIIQGAGMWYTNLNWTTTGTSNSGFVSYTRTNQLKDLSMNQTVSKARANNHKGLNGVWGTISNVWVEHFECGAWFGNYNGSYGDANCDGMTITNCRFRSNYADGVNLCQGSRNCVVSHCNFRNNGDDDMAIWPASDKNRGTCYNNTYEYNTAEHCWFASSCALYGGYNNKWQYIIVRDNYETGLRVNSKFTGYGFGDSDNIFSNIDVIRCGTWLGAYNNPFGAIDLTTNGAVSGNIKNVKFTCIDIIDALSEGLWVQGGGGVQYNNVYFCGINVNGTGKEGTNNDNGNKTNWLYGYPFRFSSIPTGTIYYQNLGVTNRGGNATADTRDVNWTLGGSCACGNISVTSVSISPTTNSIAIGESFTLAPTVLPSNATNKNVSYAIVSGGSYITLNTSSGLVTGTAVGTSVVRVTTQDGNKTADCTINITAAPTCEGPNIIVKTNTTPTIDGTVETLWNAAVRQEINTQVIGTSSSTTGYSAGWKGLYNNTNLYLLIELVKPTAVIDFYNTNATTNNWWNGSDAVQVFINSGGIKTFNFIYNGNADGTSPSLVTTNSISTTGVSYGIKKTGTGALAIEVLLPWSTIGMTPTDGGTVNMEVAVTLSNGTRLAQFTTYTPNDQAFASSSGYGDVATKACDNTPTAIEKISDSDNSIIAYDNIIKVSGLNLGQVISVYNMLGAKVYSLKATQETETINALQQGIYTVAIDGTKRAKKVVLVQLR